MAGIEEHERQHAQYRGHRAGDPQRDEHFFGRHFDDNKLERLKQSPGGFPGHQGEKGRRHRQASATPGEDSQCY